MTTNSVRDILPTMASGYKSMGHKAENVSGVKRAVNVIVAIKSRCMHVGRLACSEG